MNVNRCLQVSFTFFTYLIQIKRQGVELLMDKMSMPHAVIQFQYTKFNLGLITHPHTIFFKIPKKEGTQDCFPMQNYNSHKYAKIIEPYNFKLRTHNRAYMTKYVRKPQICAILFDKNKIRCWRVSQLQPINNRKKLY